MSDTDDSAVLVEHSDSLPPDLKDEDETLESIKPPVKAAESPASATSTASSTPSAKEEEIAPPTTSSENDAGPSAVQLVSIGTQEDQYAFTFHEDRWNEIVRRIPLGWKVAVVSVVGAFRTGKSFLLSWFLHYLHHLEQQQQQGGKSTDSKPWYENIDTLGKDGFDWKAGAERNTTGIWMWSQPFFLKAKDDEHLAVLVVDTQGLFDHETTVSLTASIFGLSTLLSSYQIYNVDKRIQEDNLQQLALFTEYARTAMVDDDGTKHHQPFQKIEFLVRDWQHFEDYEENEDYEGMEKSMGEYLKKVLAERAAADLKDTRDQIQTCFEDISCYGLPHPGFAVTKKKYTGETAALEPMFMAMLDRFCRKVFSAENLRPKEIHDRELTAIELGSYIKAYADLFVSGAKFPTAATLLDATAAANNGNAVTLAAQEYKVHMDPVAGPRTNNYIEPEELAKEHATGEKKAAVAFESIATFGSKKNIEDSRLKLNDQIDSSWQIYESLNAGRNPLKDLEAYLLPMAIAFAAYVLRMVTDMTCSPYSQMCKASSEFLSHTYAVVFCFLAILAATKMRQIQQMMKRLHLALQVLMDKQKQD